MINYLITWGHHLEVTLPLQVALPLPLSAKVVTARSALEQLEAPFVAGSKGDLYGVWCGDSM